MSADAGRLHTGDAARAVRIPCGSVTLKGELSVPFDPLGLVLFACTASGENEVLLAGSLGGAGYGTMAFNLLTTGEAADDRSRGHLRFNLGLLTQRLVCAAHWVAGEDEARHLRLGFLGSGTGSGAALVASADLVRTIGAVVCCGGRPDLAGNALRRVKSPTLFMSSPQEDPSMAGYSEDAFEMLDCPKELPVPLRRREREGAQTRLDEVARLSAEWFTEHLRPTASARFVR